MGVVGHWTIFVERLWRSVKHEDVYLKGYATMPDLLLGLTEYFLFYNSEVGYPYNYGKTFRQGCEGTEISRDAGDLLIRIGGATNCLGRGLATNS